MKTFLLGFLLLGSFNVFATYCDVNIRKLVNTGTRIWSEDIDNFTRDVSTVNECEDYIKEVLKKNYKFVELSVERGDRFSSYVVVKRYPFATYKFDSYSYDLGLLSEKGRLQSNSKHRGKNRILDENGNILLK